MKGIGGNITAVIQKSVTGKNSIGEQVNSWIDAMSIRGWIDQSSGDSKYTAYAAKIPESTHVFIADFVPIPSEIKPENSRMIIKGNVYDILLIDNPMEMGTGSQLEIYLKYTGGQNVC